MSDRVSFTVLKIDGTWGLHFKSTSHEPADPPYGRKVTVPKSDGTERSVVVGAPVGTTTDGREVWTRIEGSTSRPKRKKFDPNRKQEEDVLTFKASSFKFEAGNGNSVLVVRTTTGNTIRIQMGSEAEEELWSEVM